MKQTLMLNYINLVCLASRATLHELFASVIGLATSLNPGPFVLMQPGGSGFGRLSHKTKDKMGL